MAFHGNLPVSTLSESTAVVQSQAILSRGMLFGRERGRVFNSLAQMQHSNAVLHLAGCHQCIQTRSHALRATQGRAFLHCFLNVRRISAHVRPTIVSCAYPRMRRRLGSRPKCCHFTNPSWGVDLVLLRTNLANQETRAFATPGSAGTCEDIYGYCPDASEKSSLLGLACTVSCLGAKLSQLG